MVDGINGINSLIGQVGASATGVSPFSHSAAPKYAEPQDRVTISAQAKQQENKNPSGTKDEKDLNAEEKQQVNQLRQRDAEVKAHEQAHMAAGGGIVQGGAAYQYEHGPDGKMYAVGGEVKIDVSAEKSPEATIQKMQQVQRAALAPTQPSGTDRAVAARAAQIEAQARLEKSENSEETSDTQGDQVTAMGVGDRVDAADTGEASAGQPGPNSIFSYKADLSPTGNRPATPKGLKIDLVA